MKLPWIRLDCYEDGGDMSTEPVHYFILLQCCFIYFIVTEIKHNGTALVYYQALRLV